MRFYFGCLCILLLSALATAKDISEIRGRVRYTGAQVKPETVNVSGSDFCERIYEHQPLTREEVIVNDNDTLKNVVVWVEAGWPDDEKPDPQSTGSATLELHNCAMRPHLTVLQVNQSLKIVNADDTVHNINSRPASNPAFNFTLPPGSEPTQIEFLQPEIGIKLRSDIHPWMTARLVVLGHPYYAVTGDDGSFKLPPLPVGEYTVSAWHETFGNVSSEVLLQRDVTAEVEFTFTATGAKSGVQVNTFDTSRPTTATVQMDESTTASSR